MPSALEKAEANIEKKIRINQMMYPKKDNSNGTLELSTDLNAISNVSIIIENIIEEVSAKKNSI